MTVSAEAIKELRGRSGAGIMDCKRALEATDGAMEEAAKSDELDEYHTAVGFICDSVGYMKECGIEEEELIGHIRATYKAHQSEDNLKN